MHLSRPPGVTAVAAPRLVLAGLVALAIGLRVAFFVGLASGDPQDDGVYYGNALALAREGPRYLERFRDLPADFLANPIDQFHVRPMVTYPIAASFVLFGPGEVQATLWALVCSILTVLVVYRLGDLTGGPPVAALAAFLCAVYPLEVINGTRILSDVQLGLFSATALWLLVESKRRTTPRLWCLLSGAAAGGAYLANGRGLMILAAVVGSATLLAATRRASWKAPLWCLAGFGVVFSIEAAVYGVTTGDPLLNYHIHAGASTFKYLHEQVSTLDWGWLQVHFTNGRPLELSARASRAFASPTDQLGWYFYLFAVAALFSLVQQRHRLLVVFAAGLFVYLDFGPVRIAIDWGRWQLHYMMVFKQERFLLMLTAPLVVIAASFLRAVGARSPPAAATALILLVATSLEGSARTRAHYRAGVSDLRAATRFVTTHPDRVVYGDFWAVEHVRIFSRYRAENVRVLDRHTTLTDIQRACVMLGGSRGAELMASYVESTLPPFAQQMLSANPTSAGWTVALEVEGPVSPLRLRNLRVYCAP